MKRLQALWLAAGLLAPASLAQDSPPQSLTAPSEPAPAARPMNAAQLERAGIEAVESGRLDEAEAFFKAHTEALPESFTGWYNLAAVSSIRKDLPAAEARMTEAIKRGFSDIRTLRQDPHLASFREGGFYAELETRWPDLLGARREADLAVAQRMIPRGLELRTIDRWKLELISAHDAVGTDEAGAELAAVCDWSVRTLFPGLQAPDAFNEDPWAMVVLPDRAEFARWAIATFGPGAREGLASIGGAYDLQRRRLVAQDLGATLRHELVHVLHWRDMSRLGQEHAAWVQEGLASLIEDYDLADGRPMPVPSWRTNIVKRLADSGRLTPIEELAGTNIERFTNSRPLAKYAQSRAVMLFLQDRGKLTEFYRRYTETFASDPTALTALRDTLGMTQPEVEAEYKAWVTALPTVAETGSDLPATLGIEIENGTGDGVRVVALPPGARERTGLHVGSFITAVNARPTRDLAELIRILSDYQPGDTVTLSHRRGRVRGTSEVVLLPRESKP
jgi:hypothetical protein